jgi:2-isopropylmalate synthase
VGYGFPQEYGDIIGRLIRNIPNSDKAIFSVHCHNDLGLAVSNSLAAVMQGARQVECTINGLGERAGNAALEEVVMAVKTRKDIFPVETCIETTQIAATSRLVSSITGFPVQPNKAIVGANAFAHESGIHQDGVLKHRETYEIMKAEDVGWKENRMVLGKHSGRNAFRSRLEQIGISLKSEEELNTVFIRFKDLADKKHEIYDDDLKALISDTTNIDEQIKVVAVKVTLETGESPQAKITLRLNGEEKAANATGSGAVDAIYNAIESIVKSSCNLQLYSVKNVTNGTDSQAEVSVRLEQKKKIVSGQSADTDIVIASAKAYVKALNKMLTNIERKHPQV